MPGGVILFRRILPLASDDFSLVSALAALLHCACLIIAIVIISTNINYANASSCALASLSSANSLFLYITIGLLALESTNDLLVCWISLRGTISNPQPRRHISKLLYLSCALLAFQIGNIIYGFITYNANACPLHLLLSLLVVIVVVESLVLGFLLLNLISSIGFKISPTERPTYFRKLITPLFYTVMLFHKKQKRSSIRPKDVLKEIAGVFLKVFGGVNYTISDIVVGLILARKKQLMEVEIELFSALSGDSPVPYGRALPDPTAPHFLNLSSIALLSRYAESMYGVPLFLFSDPARGLSYMCCLCLAVSKIETPVDAIEKTMEVGCSALLCCFPGSWLARSVNHPDLLLKRIEGAFLLSPFTVSVDHKLKAVIIAIRGTLSLNDLLADFYLREADVEWTDDGKLENGKVHAGIYEIARNVFGELKNRRIFSLLQSDLFRHYEVIAVGHSLGGGVAALLAFLLKQEEETKSTIGERTTAVCFSCPGYLASASTIHYFKQFITSVVLADDLIARISPHNSEKLKTVIHNELANCNLRKIDIISTEIINRIFKPKRRMLTRQETVNYDPADLQFDGTCLFLAGNCLHLRRKMVDEAVESATDSALLSGEESGGFEPVWIDSRLLSSEILLSSSMLMDHLPNKLGEVLRDLAFGEA